MEKLVNGREDIPMAPYEHETKKWEGASVPRL